MKPLRILILIGFPVLMFTDLGSYVLDSEALLNLGRVLRFLVLALFIFEYIRYNRIISQFILSKFILLFLTIQFAYLFTDRDFLEGFWIFSKILFWGLGIGVLYAYIKLGIITFKDYLKMIAANVFIAAFFSIIFFLSPALTDYNLAAYTVLFMYPIILYSTHGYKQNQLILLVATVAILISMKRGALVAFAITSILYYLYSVRNYPSFRTIVVGILFFIATVSLGLYFVTNQSIDSEERFAEEQFDINNEKAGSGRVGMYTRLYQSWSHSDLETRLFGFGNQEDSHRTRGRRTHAHSDIFGFLYNHGYVGIFMILLIYMSIFRFYRKCKRRLSKLELVTIQVTFIILVLVNFYSGLFRSQDAIYLFAIFPIFQGYIDE